MLKFCLLLSMSLTLLVPFALAHDWYHAGCCHEMKVDEQGRATGDDCGIADLIKQVPGGTLFRQRVTGIEAVVPDNFAKRFPNEHDNFYHICVAPGDYETPAGYVYCLYEPQGS
jgi:hypothetical protein